MNQPVSKLLLVMFFEFIATPLSAGCLKIVEIVLSIERY